MLKTITIFMPVSRAEWLDQIFPRLEFLKCSRSRTNLFCIVDGDAELFVNVRNRVEASKFNQRLCMQYKTKEKMLNFNLFARGKRIAAIHNMARENMIDADYVMGIEDDTLFKNFTLEQLLKDFEMNPHAGTIAGIQIGRHGINHIGAWRTDDVYEPTRFDSVGIGKGVEKVDASGLYCYLTQFNLFKNHDFKPFERNGLGPDVDYGISLRRQGLDNYIDWDIPTVHKTREKDISLFTTQPETVTFLKHEGRWRQANRIQLIGDN